MRLLRRLFGKRYAKGGVIPHFTHAHSLKLHGAEGVFEQDGRLIYWKEIGWRSRSVSRSRPRWLFRLIVITAVALGWGALLAWLAGSVHPLAAAAAFLAPLAAIGAVAYARNTRN